MCTVCLWKWKESNGLNRKQGDTETSKLCFLFSNQFFYSDVNNDSFFNGKVSKVSEPFYINV